MNNRLSLIATGILTVAFVVCGLLDVLHILPIKIIIFISFIAIIANILIVKSNDEDEKNLPE